MRQDTLASQVDTVGREVMSVRTQQEDLADRVDKDLTAIRNQQPDSILLTPEGMTAV